MIVSQKKFDVVAQNLKDKAFVIYMALLLLKTKNKVHLF